ncbi:MAG: ASKHA domain-containing protein [Thermodesulfobacteriota bacterium]
MPKYAIIFRPSGRKIEVEREENILEAAIAAGVHVNASCGGSGTCGKCKVRIVGGKTRSPQNPKLPKWEFDKGYRLGCITSCLSDLEIEIPTESQVDPSVLRLKREGRYLLSPRDIDQLVEGWEIDPAVFKRYIELDPPSLDDNVSDLTRLVNALHKEHGIRGISTDFRAIMKLSRLLRKAGWKVTVTLVLTRKGYKLINVEPGNVACENYSIVIDLGTTTVFGQLLNLNRAEVCGFPDGMGTFTVAEASDYNAQISYGEDVISRIVYSQRPGGLQRLQEVIISTINGIIETLLHMSGVRRDLISHLVIAGNTTMTHLFLGLDPKYIREDPYVPTANFIPPVRAVHLGINLGDHVHIYIFPLVASYMGGDIVSGILGSGVFQREALTLYMDIGTNGEIVLGNKDWLASASCSAGPAFEGAGIKFGTRATRGAIERVSINPNTFEPMLLTIGRAKPIGICGSGLIDTVAELFQGGMIGQNGKFKRELDTDRVREGTDGYEYVLAWKEETGIKEDVVLTEIDIENLIRTKAAIYAGCKILLDSVGLGFQDVDQFLIAGGFGHYIDLDKAISIGLLPEVDSRKYLFVGNGSLLGARLLSFSKDLLRETERIAHMMTNLELSNNPSFMSEFVAAMFLPHTDTSAFPEVTERFQEYQRAKKAHAS